MGGKRPEQIRSDLLATDFKSRTDDEHIHEEDKQAVQASRSEGHIPQKGTNPARARLKNRRDRRDREGG